MVTVKTAAHASSWDLHEMHDRLLTILLGVFAEHENRDRAHKLRSSMIAKMREHHQAQGPPPAGYDAPNG